jgi:hypothetical protein
VGRSSFRILGFGFHVGPWNLDIGRHFNGQIREALSQALANAGKANPCDNVRVEIAKLDEIIRFPSRWRMRPHFL